jgi:very-short-patch-repair endonuclease
VGVSLPRTRVVKKHPSEGAHLRARTLRRQMTEAEQRLWRMLRSGQTEGYRFRRQVPIGAIIADFVCHAAKLIVEIDGGQHDPASEHETARLRFLEGEGYRVLRFWNNEVLENPEGVRAVIAKHLYWVTPTNLDQVTPTIPHKVTPTHTLPHRGGGREATQGGGLEVTPADLADPAAENRRLREELCHVLAGHAFPLDGGGLEATPEDLADPVVENRRLREELCEVPAVRALPLDGGGAGWGCRSRGARW